jgi:hypothetical protein
MRKYFGVALFALVVGTSSAHAGNWWIHHGGVCVNDGSPAETADFYTHKDPVPFEFIDNGGDAVTIAVHGSGILNGNLNFFRSEQACKNFYKADADANAAFHDKYK